MKIIKKYTAIDPYYTDQIQTFIGEDINSIDEQIYEFEKWLGKEHPLGIGAIYKEEVIYDSSVDNRLV